MLTGMADAQMTREPAGRVGTGCQVPCLWLLGQGILGGSGERAERCG